MNRRTGRVGPAIRISIGFLAPVLAAGLAACGTAAQQPGHARDAGATTTSVSPAQYRLTAVAFVTKTAGYGEFVHQRGNRCTAVVGATSDGGATFRRLVPVVSWNCENNAPVSALAFDGHGDGFLYGPRLFVTHDGGRTWSAGKQPGEMLAVAPAPGSIWLLRAVCPAGQQVRCRLLLSESANGGRSWSPSFSQPPASVRGYDGQVPAEPAADHWLVRTGQDAGYVLTPPSVNPQGRPDSVRMWFTANSGRSWSARTIPCGLDAVSAAMSAAPSGVLIAVCANEPSAGYQAKTVVRSADGGRSWTTERACPGGTCRPSTLDFGYLGMIDAISGSTVYLVGGRSPLLVSRDGGRDWQVVTQVNAGSDAGTSQVIFFGKSYGIVLGGQSDYNELPTLWITTNAGATWTALHPVLLRA